MHVLEIMQHSHTTQERLQVEEELEAVAVGVLGELVHRVVLVCDVQDRLEELCALLLDEELVDDEGLPALICSPPAPMSASPRGMMASSAHRRAGSSRPWAMSPP